MSRHDWRDFIIASVVALLAFMIPTTIAWGNAASAATIPHSNPTHAWYFEGPVHPYGNPHWCFDAPLSHVPAIETGDRVIIVPCVLHDKHPVASQFWCATRLGAIGQLFLCAKPNYVAGVYKTYFTVRMVPHEQNSRYWTSYVHFLEDKHGNWYIDIIPTTLKKIEAFFMTSPDHLQTSKAPYGIDWITSDEYHSNPKIRDHYTQIVLIPHWKEVTTA